MARNRYPGYCYCCGAYVPAGYGHFERRWGQAGNKWQIKCVKCASGRIVAETDREVQRARNWKGMMSDANNTKGRCDDGA